MLGKHSECTHITSPWFKVSILSYKIVFCENVLKRPWTYRTYTPIFYSVPLNRMHVLSIMLTRSSIWNIIDLWRHKCMYRTLQIFEYGLFRSFDPWAFTSWVLATYKLQGRLGVVFTDLMQGFFCFPEITVNYTQDAFRNEGYTS